MSTDFTGEGTYACHLDEMTQEKAREELHECPEERASQIETLRNWVKQQPHLTCRTDDHFLLRFLRRSKFNQLLAQKLVENFVMIRCSPSHGVPGWFRGNNLNNTELMRMLEMGRSIPLPGRDEQGRKVILIHSVYKNPEDFDYAMRYTFMVTDILLRDELNQIHGVVYLLDFTKFTRSEMFAWGLDRIQKAVKCLLNVYPVRNKAMHTYKTAILFNIIYEVFKLFMKKKLKDRVYNHKDDQESLHRVVPRELLPEEYGGEAGPLQKLIDDWKDHMMSNADEFDMLEKLDFDESKMPGKVVEENGGEDDGWGMANLAGE
ncbi:alpha-tocopherol transfer protein-like [Lineus longissimus]|uniref:alpha-tocopherol transfer protein-like n=1 Tax=Lineus longissimus TaxID=88925 RepID=UPI002B4CB617